MAPSQTSIIIFALLFVFGVFVTLKGQLPAWIGIFTGQTEGDGSAPSGKPSTVTGPMLHGLEGGPIKQDGGLNYNDIIHELGDTGGTLPPPPGSTNE